MRIWIAGTTALAALIASASPALAQPAEPAPTAEAATPPAPAEAGPVAAAPVQRANLAPTAPADGCELHIWPAERMRSITTGWLSGLGVLGAIVDSASHAKGDASRMALLSTALDSPTQLDALLALDLRTLVGRTTGTVIVVHDTPVERHTMNKIKTRRSDSSAACYSELIVADVLYQKAAIYGRSLKTLFMLREFDKGQKIAFEYKAWGGNGLKQFPPAEGEDVVAGLGELVSVFKKNFEEYAGNERKAPRTPARS